MSFYDDLSVKTRSIKDLLKSNNFSVPKYQRGYAWEAENINDFWLDIIDTFENNNDGHFFGTIIISRTNNEDKKVNRLEIIDGQQRIITFLVFFRVLYDLVEGDSEHVSKSIKKIIWNDVPRLILGQENQPFFDAWISSFPDRRTSRRGKRKTELRIKSAYSDLLNYVKEYAALHGKLPADTAKDFWALFDDEDKLFLLELKVPSDQDAFTIFETINAKRVDLTPSELIKNGVYSRAMKYGRDIYSQVESSWIGMTESLTNEASGEVDLTSYIRHLCISRYGTAIRDKQLYREFFKRITDRDSLLDLTKSLEEEAQAYSVIATKQKTKYGSYDLSMLRVIYDLNSIQVRPLLLSMLKVRLDSAEFDNGIEVITRTLIRRSLTGSNPNELEGVFISAAYQLRNSGRGALSTLKDHLVALCPSDEMLEDAIKKRPARIPKIILSAYEEDIKEPASTPIGKPTLEHIMPQRPNSLASYKGINDENFSFYLEVFGNLTLLGGYNPKVSNKIFTEKLPEFKNSQYKVTRDIADNYSTWGTDQIKVRTDELFRYIVKKWPAVK